MATDLRTLLANRLKRLVPVNESGPSRGDKKAKVIAVAASKGGVGKTTTAVNLAVGLAKFHGQRVLLVDFDSQGHVASSFRSIAPPELPTVSRLLLDGRQHHRDLSEAAYPSPVDGLDLTASDKSLNETEALLATKIGKEFIVKGISEVARTLYDAIIFDCPPNLGSLTLNALVAADHLIVPSDLTVLSLEGVGDILQTVETIAERLNHRIDVMGILPTRVDCRNTSMNEVMGQSLSELYGSLVFASEIPMNTAVNRAQLAGKPLYEYDPRAKAAVAYQVFVDEVLSKLNPEATVKAAKRSSAGR